MCPPKGMTQAMNFKSIALAASAGLALTVPTIAEARTMRAVGSSTVYPFAKMAAERVARANPRLGSPIIESTGTGGGFKLFCAGVGERFPDIANASRRMKGKEAAQCAANGVKDVTEIQIGLDGVALATARQTGISGITQRDLIVVKSVVMLLVCAVIVVNFLVDLSYILVDPRLRRRT